LFLFFFAKFVLFFQKTVANCTKCASSIPPSSPLHKSFTNLSPARTINQQQPTTDAGGLGPLDPLFIAQQRIRELELELARTKLEKVQAECHNQVKKQKTL
jgi:Rab GTPase-activating protein 1